MAGRDWTINTLRTSVLSGETTAVEVCEDYLARIDSVDGVLNAFTAVLAESARQQAEQVDQHRDAWRDRPLLGVPVTIKDVICSKGEPTTGASRILEGFRSPYDATVVRKLRDAGAVIIGKTNCDEFAMGSSTEHSAYGVTRNPWDRTRIVWPQPPSDQTQAARYVSRRPSAGWWDSSQPTAESRDTACSPSRRHWTRLAP